MPRKPCKLSLQEILPVAGCKRFCLLRFATTKKQYIVYIYLLSYLVDKMGCKCLRVLRVLGYSTDVHTKPCPKSKIRAFARFPSRRSSVPPLCRNMGCKRFGPYPTDFGVRMFENRGTIISFRPLLLMSTLGIVREKTVRSVIKKQRFAAEETCTKAYKVQSMHLSVVHVRQP